MIITPTICLHLLWCIKKCDSSLVSLLRWSTSIYVPVSLSFDNFKQIFSLGNARVSLQAYRRTHWRVFVLSCCPFQNGWAAIVAHRDVPNVSVVATQSFQRCSRRRWTVRKDKSEVNIRSGSSKWTACLNPVSTITVCTIKRLRPWAASPSLPSACFFFLISFFPLRLSPHNTQLCSGLSACGVCEHAMRSCMNYTQQKKAPFLDLFLKNCLAAPVEMETAAAMSGSDGRRLTSRWQMRLKRVVVGRVGGGWRYVKLGLS